MLMIFMLPGDPREIIFLVLVAYVATYGFIPVSIIVTGGWIYV